MRIEFNPFYTRASDSLDSDEKFIKLFSPEILTVFTEHPIWNAVNLLRSSPGGGKTTLLKIFTPRVLKTIKNAKTHDDHSRALYDYLNDLGVYDQRGNLQVAAAFISFNEEYTTLEYINLEEDQKLRLFCAALNSRIILEILNAICIVYDLSYPRDLSRLAIANNNSTEIPVEVRNLTDGYQLFNWASEEEEKITDQINSIYTLDPSSIKGDGSFYSLDFLANANLQIDGKPISLKVVAMLDDVQYLSASQRKFLLESIINKRPSVHTWVSERLKALTMDELLSEGSIIERDNNIIVLENFWAKKHKQFEKFAQSVANLRVEMAFDTKMDFASFLSTSMSPKYVNIIKDALQKVEARLKNKYGVKSKYLPWIKSVEDLAEDDFEKLIEWRALEILIFRDENKKQTTLDFDELSEEDLELQNGNDVKVAARLFLHDEFKIPFYYGISTICRLASSNIEQFLNIAGHLFDVIQTNGVKRIIDLNHQLALTPEKQEEVVKKIVSLRWKHLSTKVPMIDEVKRLMDSIGEYCYAETFTPNAWNSPGINGIAITMAQRNEIKDKILKDKNSPYYKLARCLTICIAYNLIDFKLNYKCKGKEWMILYLNRIYCAKYKLPLNNGKFKEKTLKDLLGWLNNGVNVQQKFKL